MVKYDLKKIEDIMNAQGFIRIVLNKNPTWLLEKTHEGIQINEKNEIVSFVVESGEKVFTNPDSDFIQQVKRQIQLSNEPQRKLEPENKDLITTTETKFINQLSKIFSGEQIIVPQNLKELAGMPLMDRVLLFQKTDKKFIRKRRGFLLPASARKDKKDLTDADFKMFSYVPANIMKMEANLAFGLLWSAIVETEKYFDNEVAVRGFVQVKINGETIRRPCAGSMVKKGLMDWGDCLEGAVSEMIKRGLYSLGFNADVKLGEFDEELKE